MADIRRKDLKHDRFVEEVGRDIQYFSEHRNTILIAAAAVIVAIVGGTWFYNNQRAAAQESMNALQEAAMLFSRPVDPDPEPGVESFITTGERQRDVSAALETVKTEYAGSEASAAADYYLGLLDLEQEDVAAAKVKLQSAVANADRQYAALARLALADALALEGDVAGARQEYERLISNPTPVVPANRAKLALARLLARTDPAAARPLLEELSGTSGPAGLAADQELDKLPQS